MKRGASWIILCILSVSLVPVAYGVGLIYPRDYFKIELPYEPGAEHTLTYTVRTNAGRPMDYDLWAEGDFADFVTFDPPRLEDIPSGALPSFSATIRMPDSVDFYGASRLDIYVGESENRAEGAMGVRTTSFHTVTIRIPYPYLYAELDIGAPNVNAGEPVHFLAKASNRGEQFINSAEVVLNVYDSSYELVDTIRAGPRAIPSGEDADFEMLWPTKDVQPGEYLASATLHYDGETAMTETNFQIGTLDVDLVDYPDTIISGGIRPFGIKVASKWNSKLSDVNAEVNLPGFPSVKTPSVDMKAFQTASLTAYLDLTDASPKQLEGTVTISFEDQSKEYPILVEIVEPVVEEEPVVIKEPVVVEENGILDAMGGLSTVLVIVILLMIMIEVFWIFRKKR